MYMSNSLFVRGCKATGTWVQKTFESSKLYRLTTPKQKKKNSIFINTLLHGNLGEQSKTYGFISKRREPSPKDLSSFFLRALDQGFFTAKMVFLLAAALTSVAKFGMPTIYTPTLILTYSLLTLFIFLLEIFVNNGHLFNSLLGRLFHFAYTLEQRDFVSTRSKPSVNHPWISFGYGLLFSALGLLFVPLMGTKVGLAIVFLAGILPFVRSHRFFFLNFFLLGFTFLPDMVILLGELGFFALYCLDSLEGKAKPLQKNSLWIPVLLLITTYIIQTLTSFHVMGSMRDLAMNMGGFFIFIVLYQEVDSKEKLNAILTSLVLGAALVSLYGLFQYKFMGTVRREWIDASLKGIITKRAYSVFHNPNVFAEFLVITIPMAVGLFWSHKNPWKKFVYLSIALLEMLVLFLTFSRGGLLSTAVAALVFLWVMLRPLIFLAIPMGLLGFHFLPVTFQNRILSIFTFSDSSTTYRLKMWGITKEVIQDHPMVGVGLGHKTFKQIFETYIRSMPIFHAHNTYLEVLAETGVVGFVTFLYCILASFLHLVKGPLQSKDPFLKGLGAAILASGAAILAHGVFEHIIYINRIILMLWVLVALAGVMRNIADHETL